MKPIASYQWNLRNLQLTLIVTFHWSTSKQIRWIIAPRVVVATHGDTLLVCHWLWSLHSNYIATISASIRWLKSPREKINTLIQRETSKQCQWNMKTTTLYLKLHIKSNRLTTRQGRAGDGESVPGCCYSLFACFVFPSLKTYFGVYGCHSLLSKIA